MFASINVSPAPCRVSFPMMIALIGVFFIASSFGTATALERNGLSTTLDFQRGVRFDTWYPQGNKWRMAMRKKGRDFYSIRPKLIPRMSNTHIENRKSEDILQVTLRQEKTNTLINVPLHVVTQGNVDKSRRDALDAYRPESGGTQGLSGYVEKLETKFYFNFGDDAWNQLDQGKYSGPISYDYAAAEINPRRFTTVEAPNTMRSFTDGIPLQQNAFITVEVKRPFDIHLRFMDGIGGLEHRASFEFDPSSDMSVEKPFCLYVPAWVNGLDKWPVDVRVSAGNTGENFLSDGGQGIIPYKISVDLENIRHSNGNDSNYYPISPQILRAARAARDWNGDDVRCIRGTFKATIEHGKYLAGTYKGTARLAIDAILK